MIKEKIEQYDSELNNSQQRHLIELITAISSLLNEDEFNQIVKICDNAIVRCVNKK